MALFIGLDREPRSEIPEAALEELGRASFRALRTEQHVQLYNARAGDLRIVLRSALQEPPNTEMVVAVAAIGNHVNFHHEPGMSAEVAGFYAIARDAEKFLAGQQG
jgi:hypothetical protein